MKEQVFRMTNKEEYWTSEQWRQNKLNYIYHFLLANPDKHWSEVISFLIVTMHERKSFAIEIAELLSSEELRNELSHNQYMTVQLIQQQLKAATNKPQK